MERFIVWFFFFLNRLVVVYWGFYPKMHIGYKPVRSDELEAIHSYLLSFLLSKSAYEGSGMISLLHILLLLPPVGLVVVRFGHVCRQPDLSISGHHQPFPLPKFLAWPGLNVCCLEILFFSFHSPLIQLDWVQQVPFGISGSKILRQAENVKVMIWRKSLSKVPNSQSHPPRKEIIWDEWSTVL